MPGSKIARGPATELEHSPVWRGSEIISPSAGFSGKISLSGRAFRAERPQDRGSVASCIPDGTSRSVNT